MRGGAECTVLGMVALQIGLEAGMRNGDGGVQQLELRKTGVFKG
jgi:hypothetical protein